MSQHRKDINNLIPGLLSYAPILYRFSYPLLGRCFPVDSSSILLNSYVDVNLHLMHINYATLLYIHQYYSLYAPEDVQSVNVTRMINTIAIYSSVNAGII